MSIVDGFAELAKYGGFEDIPECRLCSKMLLGNGVEAPPLGPICFACLPAEAERLRASNAELLAALRDLVETCDYDNGPAYMIAVDLLANAKPTGASPE